MRFSVAAALVALVVSVLPACDLASEPQAEPGRPEGSIPATTLAPSSDAWAAWPEGWSRLPEPPEVREGDTWVWSGAELLVVGGCDPDVEDECRETRTAFAFDPGTRSWRSIRRAPVGMAGSSAVWTGDEAIFLRTSGEEGPIDGAAYDPLSNTWRRIARAPLQRAYGGVRVWTGNEVVVWGGGGRGEERAVRGAAYDPDSDAWRPIEPGPIGLNLVSGAWTGQELLVFGSLLSGANRAPTPTSVGAAYDPASDSWTELAPSALSPQATSAGWLGDRLVAWDYEVHSQEYDPEEDRWSAPMPMPLSFSECYPESTVVGVLMLAWFCGHAALYDEEAGGWDRIGGGPLARTVYSEAYRRDLKVWRFAELVPAGSAVVMPMLGLTLNRRGIACFGCQGSPVSHWVYVPPEEISPEPVPPPNRRDVRSAISTLFYAWSVNDDGRLPWLATPRGLDRFDQRVPAHWRGRAYRIDGVEELADGRFEAIVLLVVENAGTRDAVRRPMTLVFGPGTAIGGERVSLALLNARR